MQALPVTGVYQCFGVPKDVCSGVPKRAGPRKRRMLFAALESKSICDDSLSRRLLEFLLRVWRKFYFRCTDTKSSYRYMFSCSTVTWVHIDKKLRHCFGLAE